MNRFGSMRVFYFANLVRGMVSIGITGNGSNVEAED